jgi:asparagine synthase (glutamine-hydrolysing)
VSGGLDSSLIACLMRKHSSSVAPIHLFSTVTDPPCDEGRRLRHLLETPGFNAHYDTPTAYSFFNDLPRLLWHQEEPFADGSMAAHYALMRVAREAGIPVLLSGQGADEVFAGYDSYLWVHIGTLLRRGRWKEALSFARSTRVHQALDLNAIAAHALPPVARLMARHIRAKRKLEWVNPDLVTRDAMFRGEYGDLEEYQRLSIEAVTLPGFLHYEDRNAMAFGIETRLPYLDHRLVERVFSLSAAIRLSGGRTKSLLRQIASPLTPREIVSQVKKQPYPAPLEGWLRTLAPRIDEIAYSSTISECPIIAGDKWIKLWEQFRSTDSNRIEGIWRGLITALWYERVFMASAVDMRAQTAHGLPELAPVREACVR